MNNVQHIDTGHPVVQAILAAQTTLRARRNALQLESWKMGRRTPKYLLRALDVLDHAQTHLSEEIKARPDCWVPSEVK